VCASSAGSEQNVPLEIPSAAAGKGSCDLMKDGDEKDGEEGKTEHNVTEYNTDKNPETQQSKMS